MRISYKWLSEYVSLPPAEELARRLTAVGLEVEALERVGGDLGGVVTARILSSEPHPDAEKLSITRVDRGGGEPLQVVCGAKNYRVGDVVPLATVGARLPGGLEIKKAKLRGVESFGMLCSARELGLSSDAAGLMILPAETAPGLPIAQALGLEDVLLEVNVTPNRPDALSHLGIAREVAALLGVPVKAPRPVLAEAGGPAALAVRVRIEAPEKCHRYAARVVEGVAIGPSPAWLARRLETCGVRSISNVVDATNFVLLELGHPLHAFDLDKVAGREIVVRTARPDEKLTTLDGKERTLDPDDLVISDRDRASALAGVMGGGDSEISSGTTRVLLESAWFAPSTVRRTSKLHGLHTEASHRFERGADQEMVLTALDRCAALIAELAGGVVREGAVDVQPLPFERARVRLSFARPAALLGMPVSRAEAERILGGLGFEERDADATGATYLVPSWRVDVSGEEDLVEELVRTLGYDAIPETLPPLAGVTPSRPREAEALDRAREALEAAGFSEAVNFSFVAAHELAAVSATAPIALQNPISADLAVMRSALLPSLLRNAAHNLRQRVEDVRLYEAARVYAPHPAGSLPASGPDGAPALEAWRLGGVLAGRRSPLGWSAGTEPADFYDLKAALEGLFVTLGLGGVIFRGGGPEWLHPRSAAAALLAPAAIGAPEVEVGFLGELHPRVAEAFELPRGVLAFELDLALLAARARVVPVYRPVPHFPAVLRDLAVVVAEEVPAGEVLSRVRAEPLVEGVTLFDVYRGTPLPAGRKNLAMAIRYRLADRTLTDAEADAAHTRILGRLAADPAVRAELRSS